MQSTLATVFTMIFDTLINSEIRISHKVEIDASLKYNCNVSFRNGKKLKEPLFYSHQQPIGSRRESQTTQYINI